MSGWPTKKLGTVCEFKPSKRQARAMLAPESSVSFVPMNGLGIHQMYPVSAEDRPLSEVAGSYTYFADGDVLLAKITPCFENGKLGVARGLTNGIGFGSSEFHVLRPNPEVLAEYIYYFLERDEVRERGAKAMTGAVGHRRVPEEFLDGLEIPVPPLEEQWRIVTVLDEVFAVIATATANAEKNFANARALFRSELTNVIDAGGQGWRELPLGSFCEMYQPQTIGRSDMVDAGPYPVYGANGVIGQYDRFNHAEPQLLVTCRGATCGSLNISAPNSWITGNAMVVRPKDGTLRIKLLMRIFEGAFDFPKVITGAAQPQITRQSFSPAKVKFPSNPEEQARLEVKFDELQASTDALSDVYLAKKMALSNLKQALLQKAFAGEMAESEVETIAA